jgi:hypothetical protein
MIIYCTEIAFCQSKNMLENGMSRVLLLANRKTVNNNNVIYCEIRTVAHHCKLNWKRLVLKVLRKECATCIGKLGC